MKGLRRISARILLVVVSAFAVFCAFKTVRGAQGLAGGAGMDKPMKTVCVGRFLVDLPFNAQVTFGRASLGGFDITNYGIESREEFEARLVRREESINAEKTRDGKKNMVSVHKVHHADLEGKIFVFGLNSGYLIENGVKVIYTDVTIEGFAQVNSVTVRFSAKASKPGDAVYLERLLKQVRRFDAGVIPNEPGFCMDGIMVRDPITADQRESIVMFAGMPGHEDLGIGMATMAGKTPGPGLIERHRANRTGAYAFPNLMASTLLEGPRSINGIEGEEFAFKAREWNLSTGYAFNWETQGTEDNVLHPFVSLELQTGNSLRAGGDPVQSTLSEQSLADLWRRISSSLRLRPVEQPVKADAGVQPGPILPQASYQLPAGGIAPQPLLVQPVDSTALAVPAGAVTPA